MQGRDVIGSAPFIHASAVVDPGADLGAGSQVWHFCHVMAGARLGERVVLGQGCFVASGVRVGAGSRLQNNVSLYAGVELEEDVFVGPCAVFTNVKRPRAFLSRKRDYSPTFVRRGATIGANATIVAGVTLGRYCFVAAGALVARDVPDFGLVVGVPARRTGWVSRAGEPLDFQEGRARCPRAGDGYRLVEGRVEPDES